MEKTKGFLILDKFLADMKVAKLAGDKEKQIDLILAFTEDIKPFPNKDQLVKMAARYLATLTARGKDPLDDTGDTIH